MPVVTFPNRGRPSDAEREVTHTYPGLRLHPFAVLVFIVVVAVGVIQTVRTANPFWVIGAVVVGALIAAAIRVVNQWERAAVLRLGRFTRMAGPGLFLVVPILDAVPYIVDLRIMPYNVPSQKALTRDNVPVTVDAIVYYQVADAEASVLKIEDYKQATQWGAAAVLRDLIGKSTLDEVLSERERLGRNIQSTLDSLTGGWGVKVLNVEIRDVFIAEQLEDAIAREPAAEREKRARIKLAEAEKLAAGIIVEAAEIYASSPVALQLRSMNMLFEMAMEGKNTIIFVPTETKMGGLPSPLGVYGLVEKLGQGETLEGKGQGRG